MPNLLAHMGVGGVVTRALIHDADPKWIFAGCVIPDAPWILQRIIRFLPLEVDPYHLRLYCITQSSLFFCLVLAAALAAIAQAPRRVFAVLALNSLLHLLLDACQTKWGNGVHILAPLSWQIWNFSLFWPESATSCIFTVFGLVYVAIAWRLGRAVSIGLSFRPYQRAVIAVIFVALYLLAPFLFLSGPEQADNHFIKTLQASGDRTGRRVELDRCRYLHRQDGDVIRTFAAEELAVVGVTRERSVGVSVKGVFFDDNTIVIEEMHEHWRRVRDYASLIGLGIVGVYWLQPCWCLFQRRRAVSTTVGGDRG